MSAALLAATNKTLKAIIEDTDLLHAEGYEQIAAFVKEFGGRIPAKKAQHASASAAAEKKGSAAGDVSDDDRDDEENFWRVAAGQTAATATEGFVDPREKAKKGDLSPEDEEKAMGLKGEAAELFSEGKVDEAIAKITEALTLAPGKAMYWALRADYFLKKKAALAAIHDADVALSLNSENARALRVRGEVYRHLHKWEESAKDLNAAQRVDFSDKVDGMLKFVQPRANARRDRKRHAELAAEADRERELRAKQEELRKQRQREQEEEEAERARAAGGAGGMPGGMGGFPGMGGMGGGMGGGMPGMPPGMDALFSDPEILAAMQDPETAAKLQTLMSNPMAAMQMMGDPKMGPLIQKIMMKMGGGMGGMPGMGGMGGMPGMGGMGGFPGMGGMGGMGGGAAASGAEDLD